MKIKKKEMIHVLNVKQKPRNPNVFYDMERDGITQSMVSMFLTCREKCRLYIQGWDSKYHSPALTYGSVGHAALELAYLDMQAGKLKAPPTFAQSRKYMDLVEKRWRAENLKPNAEALEYLETALALVEVTLPRYFKYWEKDFKKVQWVSLEKKFKVPLSFSNVIIPIRGKRDGEFRMGKGIWLFETKFKSMVNEGDIAETLSFETQVMMYIWALWVEGGRKEAPKGALYNIVRRTALRQTVKEDVVKFAKRVAADMDKRPDFYFMRMESALTLGEIKAFELELTRIVTDMWRWWKGEAPHYKNTYSCLGKYGKCSNLPVCSREDFSGLVKRKAMFKELEDF